MQGESSCATTESKLFSMVDLEGRVCTEGGNGAPAPPLLPQGFPGAQSPSHARGEQRNPRHC